MKVSKPLLIFLILMNLGAEAEEERKKQTKDARKAPSVQRWYKENNHDPSPYSTKENSNAK